MRWKGLSLLTPASRCSESVSLDGGDDFLYFLFLLEYSMWLLKRLLAPLTDKDQPLAGIQKQRVHDHTSTSITGRVRVPALSVSACFLHVPCSGLSPAVAVLNVDVRTIVGLQRRRTGRDDLRGGDQLYLAAKSLEII
ncbi:unnamed protein product [Calypogeia fissa]